MAVSSRRILRYGIVALLFISLFYFLKSIQVEVIQPVHVAKSSFDWSQVEHKHPVKSSVRLPTGELRSLPRIQYQFAASQIQNLQQDSRRAAVKKAFQRCWKSYRQHAWMRDELRPISGGAKDPFGGWGATLVDSLDTLWIMDLKNEFHEGVRAVASIDWEQTNSTSCNIFETTIRHLGGLLAAYDLSHEKVLLEKAVELGDMLYTGFDTPNRLPPFWLDYERAKTGRLIADDHQVAASLGSLSLEFTRLSQITQNHKYYEAIARITDLLDESQHETKIPGMWPTYFDLRTDINLTKDNTFTLGGLSDSLYEYLPKMFVLLGGLNPVYEKLYKYAAETVKEYLLFRPMLPDQNNVLFSGTANVFSDKIELEPEGQHLACFAGGMYAMAGKLFGLDEHVLVGEKLTKGCMWAYTASPTGLMPEIFTMFRCKTLNACEWNESKWQTEGDRRLAKGFSRVRQPEYLLRPEAVESVFIMYRITGQEEYRDAAWDMFEAIQRATKTELANAAIDDVTTTGAPHHRDSMESFWLAETLKYFYLIFSSPDLISLDDYVFNTEAHPLLRPHLDIDETTVLQEQLPLD